MSASSIPEAVQTTITKLGELVEALESHPLWTPPQPNKVLYFMWDFVNRSRQMLRDLPTVRQEKGQAAAAEQLTDVVGRCSFSKMLMDDAEGKMGMMMGGDPRNPLDFGDPVRVKAKEVVDSCPADL
ncbi:MAG: hypothetical protein M1837_001284 [Sclerophora amabilis]|nr:MAG: hypothetical protein M1837_001284 [Sclerophora amabilis]